jgi:hypothetical protein
MRYRIVIDMDAPSFDIACQIFMREWGPFDRCMRETTPDRRTTLPYRVLSIGESPDPESRMPDRV